MSLYKVAKTLSEIREDRAHRNRRAKAAPILAGAAAGVGSMVHDVVRKTGAIQMKMKGTRLVRGDQRAYHVLRQAGAKGIGKHVENSVMRAVPRAAAVGFATALGAKAYKYAAEERARRQEKARRRELTKRAATLSELEDQRKKGRGKILGSAATMAILPALSGAQIAGYDVGRKNLFTRKGVKSMIHYGKQTGKMVGKYGLPLVAAGGLVNEARYHIRKRNLQS